eukprot:7161766-Karenia_brevis.AAC.1
MPDCIREIFIVQDGAILWAYLPEPGMTCSIMSQLRQAPQAFMVSCFPSILNQSSQLGVVTQECESPLQFWS